MTGPYNIFAPSITTISGNEGKTEHQESLSHTIAYTIGSQTTIVDNNSDETIESVLP